MLESSGVAKPYTASKEKSVAAQSKMRTGVTAKSAAAKAGNEFESAFVDGGTTAVNPPVAAETGGHSSGRKKKEPEPADISDTAIIDDAAKISQE